MGILKDVLDKRPILYTPVSVEANFFLNKFGREDVKIHVVCALAFSTKGDVCTRRVKCMR